MLALENLIRRSPVLSQALPVRAAAERVATGRIVRAAASDRLQLSAGAVSRRIEAVAPALKPTTLTAEVIGRMNARIDPLGTSSVPGTKEARQAFYGELYRNETLQEKAHDGLKKWVMGGRDQQQIRDAFLGLLDRQGQASNPTEEVVRDLMATRKTRWERLAGQFGTEVPESFHLFRGVRGNYALEELVQALETPGRRTLTLSNHTVASWSTEVSQAKRFADAPAASVIYEADIPFHRTLADKWVDGSGFLMWCPDQNEVVVAARNLEIPLDRFEATFRGRTYRAADREALVAEWRKVNPRQA